MTAMTVAARPQRSAAHTANPRDPDAARRRRLVEVVTFVAVWVTAGCLLRLSANGYLLLGVPLTAAFQLLVRRRPLRELFAGNTSRFALSRRGAVMAAVLAVVPGYYALQALLASDWTLLGWNLAAMAGAVAAAFSLRAGSVVETLRTAALPIAVGATGFATVFGVVHVVTGSPLPAGAALVAVAKYTALYFPATFLLEEVAFRGALDAHLHHDGEPRGWQSAILISALWGLWHLPVSSGLPLSLLIVQLVAVHVALGVPLSFAWRRTRSLAGPALAHAVNDAVRNAAMLGL
jgi:membrane protease YdiL (CAAX protease family)